MVLLRFGLGDFARRGLGETDRERRVLGDGAGNAVDHGVEFGIGGDAVHQAHVVGFLRGILLGREQELHGARQADDAREALDAQEAVAEAELGGRHAKARALVAVAQVAAGREVHAAADAVAGDLGDGRLGKIVERLVAFLGDGVVAHLRLGIGAFAFELGDVGSGDEGLAARAADDEAADLGILGEVLEDADEAVPHVERDGIELRRIVEDDVAHRAFAPPDDFLFLHAGNPSNEAANIA